MGFICAVCLEGLPPSTPRNIFLIGLVAIRRDLNDPNLLYQSGLLIFSAYAENMMLKLMLILVSSLQLASTECANQKGNTRRVPFVI